MSEYAGGTFERPLTEDERHAEYVRWHVHACVVCGTPGNPGPGCLNCRNTGYNQTPCLTCDRRQSDGRDDA